MPSERRGPDAAAGAGPAHGAVAPGYLKGVTLVCLAGAIWSSAGILVRLIEAADGWQIVFYRSCALVVTLLVIIGMRSRGRVVPAFRGAGWDGVVGGMAIGTAFIGIIFAFLHTTVANALFLLSCAPFIAAVLGRVVLGEHVRRHTWIAIAAAAVGVGIMVSEGLALGRPWGDLFGLAAAAGFAGFTIALRRGGGRRADMYPAVCLGGVFSALFAAAMIESFAIGGRDLALCIGLGVFQVGIGLSIYTAGSPHLPAAELTVLSLTEVVLGPIWVWAFLGELPSVLTLVGGTIVLGAVTGQALGGMRRKRPPIGVV